MTGNPNIQHHVHRKEISPLQPPSPQKLHFFFFSFLCSSHTWTYFSCKHTTDGIPGHALVRNLVIFVVWCSYVCCKLFVLGKGDYIFVMVCVSGEFPQLYSPGAN